MCFLLILHFFWTYILLKIAIKSVNNGVDDIREVSDGEEDGGGGGDDSSMLKTKKTDWVKEFWKGLFFFEESF